jgi:hypothetical protein
MSKMGQNPDLGPCTPVNRHRRNPGYHQHPQPADATLWLPRTPSRVLEFTLTLVVWGTWANNCRCIALLVEKLTAP